MITEGVTYHHLGVIVGLATACSDRHGLAGSLFPRHIRRNGHEIMAPCATGLLLRNFTYATTRGVYTK